MGDDSISKSIIDDIRKNRRELNDIILDIVDVRKDIDDLLPKKVDFKSKWMLPERMRLITETVKAELAVRKQLDDSLKLEFDMIRKIDIDEGNYSSGDIRTISKELERMTKEGKLTDYLTKVVDHTDQLLFKEEETPIVTDGELLVSEDTT